MENSSTSSIQTSEIGDPETFIEKWTKKLNVYLHADDNLLAKYCGGIEYYICNGLHRLSIFYTTILLLAIFIINSNITYAKIVCHIISICMPTVKCMQLVEMGDTTENSVWLLYWVQWSILNMIFMCQTQSNSVALALTLWHVYLCFPLTDGIHKIYHECLRPPIQLQHGKFDMQVWNQLHPSLKKFLVAAAEDVKKVLKKAAPEIAENLHEDMIIEILQKYANDNKPQSQNENKPTTIDEHTIAILLNKLPAQRAQEMTAIASDVINRKKTQAQPQPTAEDE